MAGYTVVLADDEPYILRGLEKKVNWEQLGFSIVGTASDGIECLDQLRRHEPDVLITDIRMPGLSGLALLEKSQELPRKPVVVYISGYSEFEYARRAIELGALSYLLKPIGQHELRRVLLKARTAVEREHQERTAREVKLDTELITFLHALPPTIERRVVLDRLGFSGRFAAFACVVTNGRSERGSITAALERLGEVRSLRSGAVFSLFILSLPESRHGEIAALLSALPELHGSAVGVSPATLEASDIPLLMRQAKSAFFQEFIDGSSGVVSYQLRESGVPRAMLGDFETLFSTGGREGIHRLLDQALTANPGPPLSADQVLEFYNLFIELARRTSRPAGTPQPLPSILPDCERMVERFGSLRRLVDSLHAVVDELFLARLLPASTGSSQLISRVKVYVHANLDSDLTPEGVAEHFGVSKDEIVSAFKAEAGKSLRAYVRETRLDHVCFLLRHTRLSVQEISELCGFSDYFYLARLFHRSMGMTASEYRRRNAAAIQPTLSLP